MPTQDASRRLAAVLFADVVGYTALSSKDEDAAIRVVGAFQQISKTRADEHGGTIVKFMGDGLMAEFTSTDGAVRAALGLLEEYTAHPDVTAVDSTLRIGIHVGEVLGAEDGDIYGDGVNIASRLQSEAAPGRVFISEAVQTQLQQRPIFETRSVGRRTLKGIAEPVPTYEVGFAGKMPVPLPTQQASSSTRRRHLTRSGTIAMGMSVALITFAALTVWNAAQSPGAAVPIPTSFAQVQLTFTGVAGTPRFSPDGASVAVLDDPGSQGSRLVVVGSEDGTERAVASGVTAFGWGADDQLVWYDAMAGGTYSENASEEPQRVSDRAWSTYLLDPGSKQTTRIEKTSEGSAVVIGPLSGGAADTVLVTAGRARINQAAWSPDGSWLAATTTDASGRAALQLFARDGSSVQTLLPQRVSHPRWAAGGNAVYFVGEVGNTVGIHLVQVHPRTGEPIGEAQRVLTGLDIEDFDVGGDGSIAYTVRHRRENIWSMTPGDIKETEQITGGTAPVSSPALDASGTRLAYVLNGDLIVSDADGEDPRQITDLSGEISAVQWAPHRPALAFILQAPSERVLMVMSSDGGAPRRIPLANPLPFDLEPMLTWTGDGDAVVYVGADDMGWPGVLARVDLTTEVDTDLLRDSLSGGFLGLVASPDGTSVAVGDAFGAIRIVSLENDQVTESYPDSPGQPVLWTSDGGLVLRSILDVGVVRMVRPGEEVTSELFLLPKGCRSLVLNADATRGACTMLQSLERDVWVARPQFVSRPD
jgi:class 3 adenylate cyclase/Tol biopolymer transport system component